MTGGVRRSLRDAGGSHVVALANAIVRIGPGIDIGLQAQEERLVGALGAPGATSRRSIQLAWMFSFDVRLLGRVDEPSTLLDLEHAHVP